MLVPWQQGGSWEFSSSCESKIGKKYFIAVIKKISPAFTSYKVSDMKTLQPDMVHYAQTNSEARKAIKNQK